MGGRALRIAGVVVTAALPAGAAGAVAVGAPTVDQAAAVDAAQAPEPDWMRALRIRSEALNRRYDLGGDEWLRALRIRSEELNRTAHDSSALGS